ncbi:MAG: DUF4293 domain-containing protein [Bacteroidales bacterium]|nr:DUF4293 domain-containing protein [Bacteroidales bacterium]
MLQRIQSVYLAVAVISLVVAFFSPVMSFINEGQIWLEVYINRFADNSSPALGLNSMILLPVQILDILVVIMAGAAIFLFKNRRLQMRLVRLSIVMLLVIIALIFFYYGNVLGKATLTTPDFNQTGVYLFLVALVMFILANRSIQKDEQLVKAADRLR